MNRWDRLAVAAVLAGAVLRVAWGLIIHPPFDYLYSDMGGYVARAQRLATGADLQRFDAFFPPGTHMLLAAPMTLFGTERAGLLAGAALWCVLSSAVPFFAWRFARLLLTPAAAALTALFCALWPLYVTYGGYFTSETPSLALLLASLWAGYRAVRLSGRSAGWLGLLAGLLGGMAIASRPQLILNLAVLVVPLLFRFRRQAMALIGIVAGAAVILAGTVVHNSAAAGKPTGLSENGGLNFWMGQCDVHDVETVDPARNLAFSFGNPVWAQLGRGGSYHFEGPLVWDQGFFYKLGWRCVERNGVGHVRVLARNVVNMTATTVPWPQVNDEKGQRGVVRVSNLAYSLLMPLVLAYSVFLVFRRGAPYRLSGEAVLLLQLSCALVVAVFFFGDPRVRSTYDVFGLALLAATIVHLFGLNGREKNRAE
ncbi:MAG TPA: glycosyltransferase family 39 protein [Rubrobacter sp.]|nr:glycosyltransferase family 39 protein [Rubrobacter sp.]